MRYETNMHIWRLRVIDMRNVFITNRTVDSAVEMNDSEKSKKEK